MFSLGMKRAHSFPCFPPPERGFGEAFRLYSRDAKDLLSQLGSHYSFATATPPHFRRSCPSLVPPEESLTKPSSLTTSRHLRDPWKQRYEWCSCEAGAVNVLLSWRQITLCCDDTTGSNPGRSSQCEGRTLHSGVGRVSRRHLPLHQCSTNPPAQYWLSG